MIYEHPLAYLLGIEGLALLRGFIGERDEEFVRARIAEVRRLLEDPELADAAMRVTRMDPVAGYRAWSATYDSAPNGAFDFDEPAVREIVEPLPAGVALDAACGTGRYAALLAERGHRVIGVDGSPDMLEHARRRLPEAEFRLGDLRRLPVPDDQVDLVMCGLALTHVPELDPVLAEFARVLRPGGHLVIADLHPERILRGSIPTVRDPAGRPGRLPGYRHLVGDYLRAALPVGLQVLRCVEPRMPEPEAAATPSASEQPGPREPGARTLGPWEMWPWSLAELVPEAARAAGEGTPVMLIWHFQLEG